LKIKIALITIHWANSYGGMLQAFASQKILSQYGGVSLIDYKTTHLEKTMCLIRYGYTPRDFLRMAKDIARIFPRYRLLKKFKYFVNTYFNLTEPCPDHHSLKNLEKDYDIFVCGSDQIWNPNIVDGFDSAYFLAFIKTKKKISFASSSGSYNFSDQETSLLISYLNSFSSISTRENDTSQFLTSILENKKVSALLDPTLLLNKKEWLEALNINETVEKAPYVFVYTLKKDKFVREIVRKVSLSLNLKVVVIDQDPYLGYDADNHIQDAGPKEYIELLSGASFVITNSFHGTVFSVNFKVPFIAIKPESGLNRIEGFLKNVDLQNRLILNNENLNEIITTPLDFEKSHKKLTLLRQTTKAYLDNAFTQ